MHGLAKVVEYIRYGTVVIVTTKGLIIALDQDGEARVGRHMMVAPQSLPDVVRRARALYTDDVSLSSDSQH